jgi:outer membrane cobalamin receptor
VTVAPSLHLNPEQNWHGEVGALQQFRMEDLRLAVDIGLYVDEYFSLIEGVINPSDGVVTYQNLTRARVLGGDFGLRGNIPALSLGFSADISPIVARDLKQNLLLPSRSSTIGHCRVSWDPAPFSIALDYRYSSRIDSIDTLLGRLIASADVRDATHIVDLQLACDLSRTTSVPLAFRVEGRNLLQYDAVEGVGNLAPIRNFEAGIELKF